MWLWSLSILEYSVPWYQYCLFRREYQSILYHETYHVIVFKIPCNYQVILPGLVGNSLFVKVTMEKFIELCFLLLFRYVHSHSICGLHFGGFNRFLTTSHTRLAQMVADTIFDRRELGLPSTKKFLAITMLMLSLFGKLGSQTMCLLVRFSNLHVYIWYPEDYDKSLQKNIIIYKECNLRQRDKYNMRHDL